MRPVYFYGAISLDGYLADEHDDLAWLLSSDLAGQETYSAFERKIDTLVMGRVTYEVSRALAGTTPFYPDKQLVVLSHTHTGAPYQSGDVATVVRDLQAQPGRGIWIVGGGGLVKALLEADLIDEWWVQVVPVLLGHGKRLFEPGDYETRLKLIETTRLGELIELHLGRK
ncbi:MAG: dihydrofolate reductase family protein [Lactobacillus sp.]|jgi:dihydrofolate reductase|uniref:Dihydrofolate reductase family protein n=1 Tax=Lacticaseibacillus suilingensis TaxID=2799577 RepID=A0ABW4BCR5_9LACO|nr:dihydrofolate reductase family protein [Lacticaseibacillus suilingensis]MCI1893481.1 dihydrofolate reductase family protein [Lactobacillus sp.]MCI1917083.1 dihydrofolate reductase family protein [Lactobacillus sp.]MCI1941012.1 dihydrofolate reductase family protein [Lactobacillus sp.]MCI1971515.1 dihydrofolate reductase family protein [Lactobacillus sp.]MCI2016012.1 dihydrofolate reductase family protein [Lactobacillus sp.]